MCYAFLALYYVSTVFIKTITFYSALKEGQESVTMKRRILQLISLLGATITLQGCMPPLCGLTID